jgi:hypothetical protein
MLQSDMPFGSWRESELEPFGKIAKGRLIIPSAFSVEVADLITKVVSAVQCLYFHCSSIFDLICSMCNKATQFCGFSGQLLVVDENTRLGATGADAVKEHPWFDGIDWKQIADGTSRVPQEISNRIDIYVETLQQDLTVPPSILTEDPADLTTPEWIKDW